LKTLLAAALILAASAIPTHAASRKNPPAPNAASTKALVAQAKAAIAYQLKDPESVRWRQAAVDTKLGWVCIEVNSRNSYGGYTGFTPFFYGKGFVQENGPGCLSLKWRNNYVRVDAR
jgi:hypothetical protein